jgi:hypothetical protein
MYQRNCLPSESGENIGSRLFAIFRRKNSDSDGGHLPTTVRGNAQFSRYAGRNECRTGVAASHSGAEKMPENKPFSDGRQSAPPLPPFYRLLLATRDGKQFRINDL